MLAVLGAEPGCAPVVADSTASFELLRALTADAESSVRLQGAWALANLTLIPAGCERAVETVGVAPLVHALRHVSARGGADAGEEAHQLLRCLASLGRCGRSPGSAVTVARARHLTRRARSKGGARGAASLRPRAAGVSAGATGGPSAAARRRGARATRRRARAS